MMVSQTNMNEAEVITLRKQEKLGLSMTADIAMTN
jgi:hypothetical protein